MRFLAAAAVVISHLALTASGRVAQAAHWTIGFGWMGVSFFFILSGFILTWTARPADSAARFYRRRVARIYPAYLAALVAAALIGHFVEHVAFHRKAALAAVFLLQSWVPHRAWYFAVHPVAWSLSVEAFFYITWPLIAPLIMRATRRTHFRLLGAFAGLTIAIGVYGAFTVPAQLTETLGHGHHWQGWFVYICPLARLPEFLLGVVLASLLRSGWRLRITVGQAGALALVAFGLMHIHETVADFAAFAVIPLALLVAAVAAADLDGAPVWSARRLWVRLGEASYCLYLFHELPMRLWLHHWPHPTGLQAIAYGAATVPAGLIAAFLVHYFLERPAERALRGDHRLSVADGG